MTLPYSQRPPSARFVAFQARQEKRRRKQEAEWEAQRREHEQAVKNAAQATLKLKEAELRKQQNIAERVADMAAYVMRVAARDARIERNKEFRKIVRNMRYRTWRAMKLAQAIKQDRTLNLLGCTLEKFKRHIEKQFYGDMTWENYGAIWHVDHIKPICSFNLKTLKEQRRCFNYRNLQPLLALDNLRKGSKY